MSDKKMEKLFNKKYKNNYRNIKNRIDFDQYESRSADADSSKSFFSTPWFYGISSLVVAATICAIVIPVSLNSMKSSNSANLPDTEVAITPSTDYQKVTDTTSVKTFNDYTLSNYESQGKINGNTTINTTTITTDYLLTNKDSHLYDLSTNSGDIKYIATLPNDITDDIRLKTKDYTNNINHTRLAYYLKNYDDTSKVQWYSMKADLIVPSEIDSNQVTAILYHGQIKLHQEILSGYSYNYSYSNYYFSDGLISNNSVTESKIQNQEYIYYSDKEWSVDSTTYDPSGEVEVIGGFYNSSFYMKKSFYNSSCQAISEFDENMKELKNNNGYVLGNQIDFTLFKNTISNKFAEFMKSLLPS